ncbi:hypothetical protein PPBDW_I21736 [Photobacterium kishitanii]|nr:hypothetical protein PPBDW_I21736 [Photobacterium kishitanii]
MQLIIALHLRKILFTYWARKQEGQLVFNLFRLFGCTFCNCY